MNEDAAESCETLAKTLRDTVVAGKSAAQEQAFHALDLRISEFPEFDDNCLAEITRSLDDERVQASGDSARLILIIAYNRDLLSGPQTATAMQSLVRAYPHFRDPAALILMLEVLVDANTDEDAARLLRDLAGTATGPAAALVPTGYIHLAQRCTSVTTVESLRTAVATLGKRGSGDLRTEADMALRRLDARLDTLRKAG